MWKKMVFLAMTLIPSLAVMLLGTAFILVADKNVAPSWLAFLDGCNRHTVQVMGVIMFAIGFVATLASLFGSMPGIYAIAFPEEKL